MEAVSSFQVSTTINICGTRSNRLRRRPVHFSSVEGNHYIVQSKSKHYSVSGSTPHVKQPNQMNRSSSVHFGHLQDQHFADEETHKGRNDKSDYYQAKNQNIQVAYTKTVRWKSILLLTLVINMLVMSSPHVVNAATTTTMISPSPQFERMVQEDSKTLNSNKKKNNNDETISGFVAGAALTLTKTIVKYPMDTATVRLQMPNTTYTIYKPVQLFHNSYIGIVTPLLSNIPAGAVFFAVKDTISSALKAIAAASTTTSTTTTTTNDDMSLWMLPFHQMLFPLLQDVCSSRTFRTCIAVAVAQIPYWMVRNPSEVVKTKEQAGVVVDLGIDNKVTETTANTNISSILNRIGMYYTGYWENVIYAYPADVLKFVCYEQLSSRHLFVTIIENNQPNPLISGIETALYGAIATALAQYITTPLDVVRNRVMANVTSVETAIASNTTFIMPSEITNYTVAVFQNATLSDMSVSLRDVMLQSSSSSSPSSFFSMYIRSIIQLGRNEGWDGLLAGSIPRLMKAFISGAIQFATYEETKQALITFLSQQS